MEGYEKFKKDVYNLTTIDLNAYKEKQMRRRIDTLITKNNKTSYDDYVRLIKSDKEKFEQFINFLTINVSEFYRNPEQETDFFRILMLQRRFHGPGGATAPDAIRFCGRPFFHVYRQ